MLKLKSVAVAMVFTTASVGAFADSFNLGALPIPSSAGVNTSYNLVNVPDGTSFTDTYSFSIAGSATVSAALSNEAVDVGSGYAGAISSFAAAIDGNPLTLTGPVLGMDGGYPSSTLFLGLSQTFHIGAGAHSLVISGTTYNPGGSAYVGALTISAPAVPEPETYAMMLAGIAAIGFVVMRRRD